MSRSLSVLLLAFLLGSVAFAQTVPHHPPANSASAPEAKSDPQPSLNADIVQFCRDHVGATVGRGECIDLADAALASADGRPRPWKDGDDDFVWGNLLCTAENKRFAIESAGLKSDGGLDIRPGDIIQLRNVKFYHQFAGGYGYEEYPHHTAIVEEVSPDFNTFKVFEQNVGGKRFVMESVYTMSELSNGWLRFYRPIPKTQ